MDSPSHLLSNIVMFVRLLRSAGVRVTSGQVVLFVEALEHVGIGKKEDFRSAARAVLVNRFQDLELFERVFELFWAGRFHTGSNGIDLGLLQQRSQDVMKQFGLDALETGVANDERPGNGSIRLEVYSEKERLFRKDFAELTPEELTQVKRLMREIDWSLQTRPSRRKTEGSKRELLDLRATVRQSLRHGGESLLLYWRQLGQSWRSLVVLCDISGSMQPYSRLLLEFVYALNQGSQTVESFAFGTRLTRLTRYLRQRDVDHALRQAAWAVRDWGGGTRIGEAVKEFNYSWGRRVLKSSSIVLVISDGWDRGDMELLKREAGRLQRSCWRLIWLNPLLGSPGYEPKSRGIRAVLPLVDLFLPVHNLASLEQLGETLRYLTRRGVGLRYSDLVS